MARSDQERMYWGVPEKQVPGRVMLMALFQTLGRAGFPAQSAGHRGWVGILASCLVCLLSARSWAPGPDSSPSWRRERGTERPGARDIPRASGGRRPPARVGQPKMSDMRTLREETAREIRTAGLAWWRARASEISRLGRVAGAVCEGLSAPALRALQAESGSGTDYKVGALRKMDRDGVLLAAEKALGPVWVEVPPEARVALVAILAGRPCLATVELARDCGCAMPRLDEAVRAAEEEEAEEAMEQAELAERAQRARELMVAELSRHFPAEVVSVVGSWGDLPPALTPEVIRSLVEGSPADQLRTAHALLKQRIAAGSEPVMSRILDLGGLNPRNVLRGSMVVCLEQAAALDALRENSEMLISVGILWEPSEERTPDLLRRVLR